MKTCYIAAPFIYDMEGALRHDVRSLALGDAALLRRPQTPAATVEFCGETYRYIGPFWEEETDDGVFTDCDSACLVRREKALIDQTDRFVAVFDGTFAPGTAAELVYAATIGKDVAIIYLAGEQAESDFPSMCWYPIVMAQTIQPRTRLLPANSFGEIAAFFHAHTDADYRALLCASNRIKRIG